MAIFNDLAVELQTAIWQLVLPYRGVHWVEIEGPVHDAPYVRDSIRFVRESYPDGKLPECSIQRFWGWSLPKCEGQRARYRAAREARQDPKSAPCPGLFFLNLVPVVPSVWGEAGPGDEYGDGETSEELAEEVAYTRRCRQLSTYTQVAALLQTCFLSRHIALEYTEKYLPNVWRICRSKGLLHRPRPLDVWEAQYRDENSNGPDYGSPHTGLVPMVRSPLDLVVLRLHDSHGRATPLLRQAPLQFPPESPGSLFPFFHRVAIEWHPRWAEEREEFRSANVQSIFGLMSPDQHESTMLYWLVDGVPRPNWKRDYPRQVPVAFQVYMDFHHSKCKEFQSQYNMEDATMDTFLAGCDLDLEFEANGRRYYVVFVVIPWDRWGLGAKVDSIIEGPFLGGEAIWPEKLRPAARFAFDMLNDRSLKSLMTCRLVSYILSWEPI